MNGDNLPRLGPVAFAELIRIGAVVPLFISASWVAHQLLETGRETITQQPGTYLVGAVCVAMWLGSRNAEQPLPDDDR